MKARTLVLMLGILLMSFTGFGATTSDLTENSTADIIQLDDSVIVVSLEVESLEAVSLEVQKTSLIKFSIVSNDLNDLEQPFELTKPDINQYKYDGDVGWKFKNENKNYNQSANYYRSPRDAIRC